MGGGGIKPVGRKKKDPPKKGATTTHGFYFEKSEKNGQKFNSPEHGQGKRWSKMEE